MQNNRMQNFGGGTAIAITPIHRDIMNGLILKGEFDLLKNTTHLDEVFKLAQHPEQTKLAIDTYLNFTQQIESLNCSLTFFGFRQGGWIENGQMQVGDWKSILSDDKKSFKKPPVLLFMFSLQSKTHNNPAFEVKYYIPLEFMLLALASMVSHIWLQIFFDENQPIPWSEIEQVGRGK
ncbi:hypothetical protein F7R25_04245 [Burkholderia stagnalis]|uniref:Uncharacterized protein n=1 Tax=Burkholderia stagnalis TaxID=1503054 RepID=A0A6L3N352_9BURK|nr:hypothetical protein [Burkholderia stagnalis]KAB0640716.1 hypothetical protein F7R25_04245 [Burkholderia stagnalis]VWB07002.1 hypothetical protein BST28156_00152 [Burkholderia stagnalis]